MGEERELKRTFLSKEEYVCPVCETVFHREELLSGSGRLNAGELTDELHRLYLPSVKYGELYPLVYQATVCPACWFASIDSDFRNLPEESKAKVTQDQEKRYADTERIFENLDFYSPRTLAEGAASLYLTLRCYDFFPPEFSPVIKQGIAALRAGWLLEDMDKKNPGQHYDWLSKIFKRKACFLYNEAIKREQNGKESLSALKIFGPDTDKNYAYEGALYLSALLHYKYGPQGDPAYRISSLEEAKRTIARIFGLGKSSKNKPGPLLEHARALYDAIRKELNEYDE